MSTNSLRIRCLSLKDADNQPISNILFYVKKLAQIPTSAEPTIKLKEKDSKLSIVLACNETFDMLADDDFCQILFINSNSKTDVFADLTLQRNDLVDEYTINSSYHKNHQPELICSVDVDKNYIFQFSLQLVENSVKENKRNRKISTNQLIRGHLMLVKQFNKPVSCAICNKFIWGIYHQGYECSYCLFVTHRKCRQNIPFDCQQSINSKSNLISKNYQCESVSLHRFLQYRAPLVQSLISREHNHCNHCGSQVLRHALKCIQCHFIIHKHCEQHVPSMCAIPYMLIGKRANTESSRSEITSTISNEPEISNIISSLRRYSTTSSISFPPLNLLLNENVISLPKFSDFKCIGCLGSGRFASVYCVQHIPSEKYLAIKVIDGLVESARQQFEVERQILYRFSDRNPYMIKAYCSFHQGSKLFLAMEFVDGDTLHDKIHKKRMNENEIRFYLAEIISVIQYLHANDIIYRDLKLEHIIVNSSGHIRLVDFGLGRILRTSDEMCHTICGTRGYLAPEVRLLEQNLTKDGYSYSVDYWALGMIFAQMLCGEQFDFHPQLSSDNNNEIGYQSIIDENLQLSRDISPEARSCLNGLLEIDPTKRFGSPNSPHGSLREHPFFHVRQKINWQEIDEGLFKSLYNKQSIIRIISDMPDDIPFPRLLFDRSIQAKNSWINAGKSTCLPNEEEQFKLFDYVNQSTWYEFN
ncbi:unnamed protein product [Adineta steineri]|uniref:protein kinase C n=2 Tax=Adineta steineri TaxID=433720 RepID=A0A819CXJ7_9BILA|nr:unnamed protein product [Adineta steineri]CAF3819034.1 unnamed protein product [Adineta steineri]